MVRKRKIIMVDIWTFVPISIPTMIVLGIRHGLNVDHDLS